MKRNLIYITIILLHSALAWGQVTDSITRLRLTVREDMLNLKSKGLKQEQIYSASKTLEKYLSAPLSATIITQKMIEQTGVTNIAEALRLAPGVLVQQKTNGNYEVHIRQSFSSQNNLLQDAHNQQLLVVIDHAPQYDYLFGGILWEALPVGLQDIERIEVIRTPSVVFFGSAAITGVIHIFTKQIEDNDLQLSLNSQAGIAGATIQDASRDLSALHRGALSFGISDRLRFRLSGHYQFINRFQDEYFLLNENRYIQSDSLLFFKQNVPQTNLNTKLGLERQGINLFTTYQPSKKVLFTSQLSYQNSHAQTILTDDTLALVQRKSTMYGINVNGYFHNFHLNISRYQGVRNYALGYTGNDFDVAQTQASLNYVFTRKTFQAQSGVGVLQSENTPLSELNPSALSQNNLTGYHAFAKFDFTPIPAWRLMTSVRGDKYAEVSPINVSYQLSSTFTIQNHLIRGAYTYNEGVAFVRQFSQQIARTLLPEVPSHRMTSAELGWTARIASKINTSVEVFYNQRALSNTYLPVTSTTDAQTNQVLRSQIGATGRVQAWLNKLQVEVFASLQRSGENWAQLQNGDFKNTAQLYGGIQLNYLGFLNRFNANVQVYFYDQHQFDATYGSLTTPSRTLVNLMVSYKFWREHYFFLNARNALNTQQKEYAFADDIAGMYLLGLKINI
ncbi:hypothetical protein BKI52_13840 [marine bacterium AO1-C]|nr:hypothetical protein BKI52_13840 [marine bacterium AO1-C]